MKSCPNCNMQSADDANFCSKCGYKYHVDYSENCNFEQKKYDEPLKSKNYSEDVINAKISFKPELIISIVIGGLGLMGTFAMEDFKTSIQVLCGLIIIIGLFWIRPAYICLTTKLKVKKDIVVAINGTKKMTSKLTQIQNITVDQTLSGLIFGYYTICISTTTDEYEFKRIKNANEIQSAINNQVELNKKIEMEENAKAIAQAMVNEIIK